MRDEIVEQWTVTYKDSNRKITQIYCVPKIIIKKIIIINQQISCDCRFKVNNINKCLLFSQLTTTHLSRTFKINLSDRFSDINKNIRILTLLLSTVYLKWGVLYCLEKIKSFGGANFICWNFGNFSFVKTFSSNSSTPYFILIYWRNKETQIIISHQPPLLCQSNIIFLTNYFHILSSFCYSLSHHDWPEYITAQSYTQSPRTKYLFWQTSIFLLLNESLASQSLASDFPLFVVNVWARTESVRSERLIALITLSVERKKLAIWWFLSKVTDFMTGASSPFKIEKVTIFCFLFTEKI